MSLTYYTISTLVALSISVYLVLKKSTTIATMVDLTKMALLHWPKQPPQNKVDTHHHFVPDFYAAAVESAGGDPSGWQTPSWSLTRSDAIMSRLGIKTVILSVTAPGACILKDLRHQNPGKVGFFANLPSLLDTDATLEELGYALDTLHADGVVLFTRYGSGNTYLGHPDLHPVWAELNRRKCVVFVHPTHPVDTTKVNENMPQPMIDYPHETTRAAMDMLLQGTRSRFPDCKVILSHGGGTLPYIISRITTPLNKTPDIATSIAMGVTYNSIIRDLRSFHYDLALSSSPAVCKMLFELVPHDHILYGSDFPYAPLPAYPAFLDQLEGLEIESKLRDNIYFRNAEALFRGHSV